MMIDKPQLEASHLGLLSIDIHYENNTISVGNYIFNKPIFFVKNSTSKRIYSDTLVKIIEKNKDVLSKSDKSIFESIKKNEGLLSKLHYKIDVKAENHFFSKYVGEIFYTRMRKAMFLLWLYPSDIKTAISACAFNHVIGQTLNIVGQQYYLPIFKKRAADINQAVIDGNINITPFIVLYDMNPNELKAYLGKSTWKTLCSNSITRNKLIVSSLREPDFYKSTQYRTLAIQNIEFDYSTYKKLIMENKKTERRLINELIKIKSTLLKIQKKFFYEIAINNGYLNNGYQVYAELLNYFIWVQSIKNLSLLVKTKEDGKYYLNPKIYGDFFNLFHDTQNMSEKLELPFNETWSLNRMRSEHDRMARIMTIKSLEGKDYDYLYDDEIMEILEIEFKEFNLPNIKSKLITSLYELAVEGAEMSHCVANYDELINKGLYLVFKLHDSNKKERSTLGLYRAGVNSSFIIDQHYGRFNSCVKNEDLLNASNIILELINDGIGYNAPGLAMAM